MHEMGIARQLLEISLNSIPEDIKDPKVKILNLRIGKLAAVVEHSLQFCFEIIAKDTPLENVELNIEAVPVKIQCQNCKKEWETDVPMFRCNNCNNEQVKMISGREIEIISMELEVS